MRLGVALVLVMVAGGCRPSTSPSGGVVVVAFDSEPAGFNPRTPQGNTAATNAVMARVWPSVWTITPSLDVGLNRDLVLSAEVTRSDPQTIVYRLNPEARWSDGDPIDAEDFIYNWSVQMEGTLDVDGSPLRSVGPEAGVTSVASSDGGSTVTVVLGQPDQDWRALFSAPLAPAHIAQVVGWNTGFDDFDPAVVLSGGPLRIDRYHPGQDLILVRNEAYWGDRAKPDSVVIRFLGDSNDSVPALRNGEVDVIAPRPQIDLLRQLENLEGVVVQKGPALASEFLEFNLAQPLTGIPQVRQAVALSLDRAAIVERTVGQIDSGAQVLNHRLFLPGQAEYRDTSGGRYDRPDPTTARARLEAIGFVKGADGIYARGGERLSLRMTTTAGDALRRAEAELVQVQVREAGIELRIVGTDNLGRTLMTGDFDIAILAQGATLSTSLTEIVFGSGAPANNTGYANPVVDDLYARARVEGDAGRRTELFHRIDEILWTDLPRIPLYQQRAVVAFRSRVANVELNPAQTLLWNAERWEVTG